MNRGPSILLLVALRFCCVSCGAAEPGPEASEQLGVPLMVTQIVSVRGPAKLSYVHGGCNLMRDETGGQVPRVGQALRDGDVLDLGDDCSVRIKSTGKPDIALRRENGRFFKLEIRS